MAEATLINVSTRNFRGLEHIKSKAVLRAAAVLTDSYVDTDYVNLSDYSSIAIFFDITQGSLTSFEYQVYTSIDGVTWYLENTETITAAIITDSDVYYTKALSGNTTYYKIIQIPSPYLKLKVKGTGTVTGSSCTVTVVGVQ